MIKPDIFVLGKSEEYADLDYEYTYRIPHDKVTRHTFNYIKRVGTSPYFYLIKESTSTTLDLTAEVYEHNNAFHFWNGNDAIRLFNRKVVLEEPQKYTDEEWWSGSITNVYNIVDDNTLIYDTNKETRHRESYNKTQCQTVILTRGWPQWANKMSSVHYPIIHVDNFELDLDGIDKILTESNKEVFNILRTEVNADNGLDYIPPFYDEMFMHIWNNSFDLQTITRAALEKSAPYYTDQAVMNDMTQIKNIDNDNITTKNEYDIIYLSYDEECADDNFEKLQSRFPRAKRVHGVRGIFKAHQKAAQLATTPMFFVVDADAIITDTFDFDYTVSLYDTDCVFVWRSMNPCNGLKYGYGGIKLFPTQKLRDARTWNIDFTTSISNKFKAIEQVSNITNFNTSAFSAWRSGFREAVKLASSCIKNGNDWESQERLETWTTIANDVPYAKECRAGAIMGAEYGKEHAKNLDKLARINDFEWLEIQYEYTKND